MPGNSATVPRYQAGLVLVTIKKKKEEKKRTSTLHRDSKQKAHTDACRTINHSVCGAYVMTPTQSLHATSA